MKKVLLLMTVMMALAGCPDSGSSSKQNINNLGYGACVNCTFSQATFAQNVSSQISQGILTLSLIGDVNQMNMLGSYAQNPLFSYQGQMVLGGTLNLNTDLYLGACRLPVGSYTLQTLQVGTYNRGVFMAPAVELVGPVRVVVSVSEGVILTNGNGIITSFGAVMRGQSGPSAWGMGYPGYPSYGSYGQQANCGDYEGVRF